MKKITKEQRDNILKELYQNHNHSWLEEIIERNKNNFGSVAITYRGTKITYGEYFELVVQYAKALKQYGITKGTEFVVCLRQTPDYPILYGAATLIGAKINLMNVDFADKEDIINNADAKIVLVNNWDFKDLAPALKNTTFDKKIVVLDNERWEKDKKASKLFKEVGDKFYKFNEEEFKSTVANFDNILTEDKFVKDGENFTGEINGHSKLDDVIAITYTSGTTKPGYHKGVEQRNIVYTLMGRYHDPEITGMPKMKNTISYVAVPTHADTTLLTGLSDTMMEGGTVALDPIIDENYFIYALALNKAGLAVGTRSFWIKAMKNYYKNPDLKDVKFPYLYVPSEGGEPLTAGEEKALNRWLKEIEAGTAITHTPFSVVKMTVGGGDSENGSIFLALYRAYKEPLKSKDIAGPIGLEYYAFADVEVLREDGTLCGPNEMGRLVINSPIAMKNYHNNPQATLEHWIYDANGKKYGNLNCYGFKDKRELVYVKGRIGKNDPKIKPFEIADEILKDTKNIMSCEVICFYNEDNEPVYVAHIETQYRKKVNVEKALISAELRCKNKFGKQLDNKLLFRVRSHEEGFPSSFTTAKRDTDLLRKEGLENCIWLNPTQFYFEKKREEDFKRPKQLRL